MTRDNLQVVTYNHHGLFGGIIGERTFGHRVASSGGGVLGQNSLAKPEAIKSRPSINKVSIGQAWVVSRERQVRPCRSHMADVSSDLFELIFGYLSFSWS